jgi:hypothetical protein
MRAKPIMNLVQLYSTFFVRKILSFGVLQSPLIRILLLIGFLVILTFVSFSVFAFFSEVLQTEEVVLFLLNTYSSTIVLWTIVVTIFLKVIFSKVDGFLKMTINFPVSNKERNFSVFLYETLISFTVIFVLSFSVILSMILVHQLAFIDVLFVNLLYMSTLTYLILQVISKFISFICSILHIPKLFHIINLSILVLIFAIFFSEAQVFVTDLANDFIQETNETESILLFLQEFHASNGFLLTTVLYLVFAAVLISIIILMPDHSYMSNSKHILFFDDFKEISTVKAYVLSTFRNMNTIQTIALVYLASLILIIFQLSDYILYPIILLAFNSIYSYVQSQPLRTIMYKFNYKAWKDYLYLIGSQLIISYIASLPLLISGMFMDSPPHHLYIPYLIVTFGAILFIMAGILFPPYHDNPFSVITSVIVVTIPILIIGISVTFLNLGIEWNIAIFIFFYLVMIQFSIQGLINLRRGVRNEGFR